MSVWVSVILDTVAASVNVKVFPLPLSSPTVIVSAVSFCLPSTSYALAEFVKVRSLLIVVPLSVEPFNACTLIVFAVSVWLPTTSYTLAEFVKVRSLSIVVPFDEPFNAFTSMVVAFIVVCLSVVFCILDTIEFCVVSVNSSVPCEE